MIVKPPLRLKTNCYQPCATHRSSQLLIQKFACPPVGERCRRCVVDEYWSERRDLNSGPLAPHASALPGCATLRHDCSYLGKTRAPGWGSAARSNHDTPFSAG